MPGARVCDSGIFEASASRSFSASATHGGAGFTDRERWAIHASLDVLLLGFDASDHGIRVRVYEAIDATWGAS
jgi:hypothetical protein